MADPEGKRTFRLWTLENDSYYLVADVDTLPELKEAVDQHSDDDYAYALSWRTGSPRFLWGTFAGRTHNSDTRTFVENLIRRKR